MKTSVTYGAEEITVYAIDLCYYGDRGDYEVFPNRELGLDLEAKASELGAAGYEIEYPSPEVLIFHDSAGAEYTMYSDGRLIVESLRPGSTAQALDVAAATIGYGKAEAGSGVSDGAREK